MKKTYDVIPYETLLPLAIRATDRIARFDERVSRSPIREGVLERLHFQDAAASLWNDGELVHLEDLVLHDAHMDIRSPTQEVTDCHRVLRARRHLFSNSPDWALSSECFDLFLGIRPSSSNQKQVLSHEQQSLMANNEDDFDAIDLAFKDLDALLARTTDTIEKVKVEGSSRKSDPLGLFYDSEWNEEDRLSQWLTLLGKQSERPPIFQAAIALDAWEQIDISQKASWFSRQIAAAVYRRSGGASQHLPCLNIGLKNLPKRGRNGLPLERRLTQIINAFAASADHALAEHDKLIQAKARMERITKGRRSNSRLPDLIELALSKPIISTSMIVDALGTTPQGAVGLANQLEIRELTGRGRFRAWGII